MTMATPAKHPHQENPSIEEITALLKKLRNVADNKIIDTYITLHQCIVNTLPEISFATDLTDGQTGYGAKQFGCDGWGMVALAKGLLKKIGFAESDLRCGSAPPMNSKAMRKMLQQGETWNQLHNCRSGKHAAMLALAAMKKYGRKEVIGRLECTL